MLVSLGSQPKTRTVKVDFLVVNCLSTYNVILGRPTLNKIRAIVSTTCLTMKFFVDDGEITTIRADQVAAQRCYNASLEVVKKEPQAEISPPPSSSNVMLIDLDVRGQQEAKGRSQGENSKKCKLARKFFRWLE